ncbi:hypothetical protein AA106556_1575 [Neokomagataea tanensis NBRC 106556]|uniref:Nucleotide-diphospho-sugar transferase domain-containing protein n=2 Tax=Acetobacteraceae TaxID=433 RepID=A0ABQ0QKA8_9PROT|nr:hypothetical protein AA106556_1575 [Neokomagataea tanensis NBRC 106556]
MPNRKQCFIIPIHSSKCTWIGAFLDSVIAHDPDRLLANVKFFLGASNGVEARLFQKWLTPYFSKISIEILSIDDYLNFGLNMPSIAGRLRENHDGCTVNLKKFCMMFYALKNGYNEIFVSDDDMRLLKSPNKLFDDLVSNYNSGLYLGSPPDCEQNQRIVEDCVNFFDDTEKNTLFPEGYIYSWFFDAPFYTGIELDLFFNDMSNRFDGLEGFLAKVRYESFEHLIFQYWRVLRGTARIIDTSSIGIHRKTESLFYDDFNKIHLAYGYQPVWVYLWEIFHQPDMLFMLPKVALAIHADRMFIP